MFFVTDIGTEPRMVDFMVWPWFERFATMEKIVNRSFLTNDATPNLVAYVERMLGVPAVQKCSLTPDQHLQFFQSMKSGAPNYDIGLE